MNWNLWQLQGTVHIFIIKPSWQPQVVLVPPNCTDRLQPLDLSVNKAAKDFFFESLESGTQSKFVYNWMEHKKREVNLVQCNPSIVKNGFKAAGIFKAL